MSESCSGSCSGCASGCPSAQPPPPSKTLQIKDKILVLSGKGGVGKSTVAASLAVMLAREGRKVGLLDVDFHGPSQPTLFNLRHYRMDFVPEKGFQPVSVHGIKLVSLGLLLEDSDQAVIWRGPVKNAVMRQLLEEVDWGDIDTLILDFPPGNGDEVLAACQMVEGDKKAIVVTTPQEIALSDCRKCLNFCMQLKIPVVGVVENMSGFVCPECNTSHTIFSKDGGAALAEQFGLELIAKIPLDPLFLQRCDSGELATALCDATEVFKEVEKVAQKIL